MYVDELAATVKQERTAVRIGRLNGVTNQGERNPCIATLRGDAAGGQGIVYFNDTMYETSLHISAIKTLKQPRKKHSYSIIAINH